MISLDFYKNLQKGLKFYTVRYGTEMEGPMNALSRAQRKWRAATARQRAAIARQYDRFWSVTLTGSVLLLLLASMTSHIR